MLQSSDLRFRAISALISAASPEKTDRNTKRTTNIHQQSSPLSYGKYKADHSLSHITEFHLTKIEELICW